MPSRTFMKHSKGVISEGGRLVFMDDFVKRYRGNSRRANRELKENIQPDDLISDPDRINRVERLDELNMFNELFGGTERTSTSDTASNRPREVNPEMALCAVGSRVEAKHPTEIISTEEMQTLVTGKKKKKAAPVRSLGPLETSPQPQEKKKKASSSSKRKTFGGFEVRDGRGRGCGRDGGRGLGHGFRLGRTRPSRASVRGGAEEKEGEEKKNEEVEGEKEKTEEVQGEEKVVEAEQQTKPAGSEAKEKEMEKTPALAGMKRKAEDDEKNEDNEEVVLVPTRKVRRLSKRTLE
ncbi:uncharacterized protein BKCO1_7900028 [Diplodia corticola]|uniref:Uncharacterized protein n=1 Tax=Diplodia corticola TaxID=236234 RepID=A0A1J9RLY4_9PEZI|nr:uncharacterized protein BKCO1_7900028 [Diplodia corticola]OJD29519.1 hypothetical protein BKCO1_7900028 [Diplodia corticola]